MSMENSAGLGVLNSYGPRTTNGKYGAPGVDELIQVAIWDFTYSDLPDGASDALSLDLVIPANSTIVDARLLIDTAFTSTSTTTDLEVGLYSVVDGTTAIDADGLLTAVNASQTTIAVAGALITGTGALVGQVSSTTVGGVLVVASSAADLLTGAGRVIVRYILNS